MKTKRIFCKTFCYSLLLATVSLLSCSKEKEDAGREDPYSENIISSRTRVVLAGGMEIMVNEKKLSNWSVGSTTGGGPENPPNPTPYFPTTGKPGNSYFIPAEFIDAKGKALLKLFSPGGSVPLATTEIEDSYTDPVDYYYNLQDYTSTGVLTPVPRPVAKPSQPHNILIRVVNLASDAVTGSDASETLSLGYANGQPVSAATSGIAKGHWSEYTEIPYGTYEFRMLIDGTTRQYPLSSSLNTNSAEDFRIANTLLYYTQRHVFQPGGVYTIVVSLRMSRDPNGASYPVNMFTVISDLTPSANLSYARMQVANGFPDEVFHALVDESPLPSVSFGEAGDYIILTTGVHTVKWVNGNGAVEKEQKINVKGGDNFTIAFYPDTDKHIATTILQNNMSGIINNASNEDGSDGSTAVFNPVTIMAMNIQTRFMNLCPELPYVSFTAKNGAPLTAGTTVYPPATVNLKYGTAPDAVALPYPYINLNNTVIEAYASGPGFVPGNRLDKVPPLSPANFTHLSAEFYSGGLPVGEAGVYTVALVGHYADGSQPKLIVIKHNK